eukprot:m.366205 g.366205  ORF g.366205 m.366205 type:complete len:122 (-) comp16658_c2_seq30:569-934(-)
MMNVFPLSLGTPLGSLDTATKPPAAAGAGAAPTKKLNVTWKDTTVSVQILPNATGEDVETKIKRQFVRVSEEVKEAFRQFKDNGFTAVLDLISADGTPVGVDFGGHLDDGNYKLEFLEPEW